MEIKITKYVICRNLDFITYIQQTNQSLVFYSLLLVANYGDI